MTWNAKVKYPIKITKDFPLFSFSCKNTLDPIQKYLHFKEMVMNNRGKS